MESRAICFPLVIPLILPTSLAAEFLRVDRVSSANYAGGWQQGQRHVDVMGRITDVSTAETPIPAAVWLLGSGLLGIIGLKRKFRK